MKTSVGARMVERLNRFAEALKNKEVISERFTCRRVVLDLDPTAYNPKLVKTTRALLRASQAVFAQFLGVAVKTVQAWEQGTNTPNDMACRFMDEIRRDPDYWRNRFQGAVVARGKQGREITKSK